MENNTNYNIELPAITITETVGDVESRLEFKTSDDYAVYMEVKSLHEDINSQDQMDGTLASDL